MLTLLASPVGAAPAVSIWQVTSTPNPHPHDVNDVTLAAVSSTGAADAWAIGINQDEKTVRHPLVEHWNGQRWALITVPEPSGRQSWFNGVDALSPANVWAVGESANLQASNQDELTLIEHWDGHTWTIVSSPDPSTGPNSADVLEAVTGVGASAHTRVGRRR